MTKLLVVGNWKCNPVTLKEANKLFNLITRALKARSVKMSVKRSSTERGIKNIKKACLELNRRVEVVICPSFLYLPFFVKKGITVGSQDVFWEERGAFTGEVSPKMLKDLGVKYVIIGHSERRKHFRETDEMINKKIKAVLKIGLSPILCIGDKSRESKKDIEEIRIHLEKDLLGIRKSILKNLIITYEPIWAISTTQGSVAATPQDAGEGVAYIKKALSKLLGKSLAQKIRILYGGSVNSKNVRDFIRKAQTDGVLVGAASLNPKEFSKIVRNVAL